MIIGCPSEVKIKEHRVGLVASAVQALVGCGHTVLIQEGAGSGCHISNEAYHLAGAQIISTAKEIWERSELIVKVKEPTKEEYGFLRPDQIIFTFFHLAADPILTQTLLQKQVSSVAYETIQVGKTLPLLRPMSEVAGRLAIQIGAWCLEKPQGGKGILLSGVIGVRKAKVVILGGGTVGSNAARIALGMGAQVSILDTDLERLEALDGHFEGRVQTLYSTSHTIEDQVLKADLVIGAVLMTGAKAPQLVTKQMITQMQEGSVIIDVAVDQGGCVETMHPTTHENPTFLVDGIVHYGVSNMPGAVPQTSTFALAHATFPYLMQLANLGLIKACLRDPALAKGLNTHQGRLTYEAVATSHHMPFTPWQELV